MLEIGTSGTVRGGGGNILTYSETYSVIFATNFRHLNVATARGPKTLRCDVHWALDSVERASPSPVDMIA